MSDSTTLLLAIDTSTELTGIALYDGCCLDDVSWSSCRDHTVMLLDEIDHQVKRRGRTVREIGAIGVAIGPGRFNALRVGMSIAKGLAFSLEAPLIGIPTLEAAAHPFRHRTRPVAAVIDAGRERVAWRVFDCEPAEYWAETRNTSADEFVSSIASIAYDVCVTGEVQPALREALTSLPGVTVPPLSGRLGRAAAVAELAYQRMERGEADDLAMLEPVYLHGARAPQPR
ncbi:MAG: tRNA (adenosine(37)-N6)-threonylcarbamoyltransferase complex dimerization subunit type 1 TsaB [Thermomicrobiales bacterium]|nr:tRNA (adenosine(37)-N6)-threonylcarbamoyltransferase complex dimerization subunit type 1 TsaB [Thermomicrobiales bacterium]